MSSEPDPCSGLGAVILAAGESKRLGQPKQLLVLGGRTLLGRTIDAALEAGVDPVVVVLGAFADEIENAMRSTAERVRFVRNPRWQEGMGTSISCGVRELQLATPAAGACFIMVCDQPALGAGPLKEFVKAARPDPESILVADYGGSRGPPVLFPRRFFDELLSLRGDAGAREVHKRHADLVRLVPFPGGALDIDTAADLGRARA